MRLFALIFVLIGGMASAEAVPEEILSRLRKDPEPFVRLAEELIHGYGQDGTIDRLGVDRYLSLERAEAAAGEMRRLLAADLDLDGTVQRDEMAALVAAEGANGRGKLWRLFEAADGDGDGRLVPAEILAQGRVEADRTVSGRKAALARAVLLFDGDEDGKVAMAELQQALAALGI